MQHLISPRDHTHGTQRQDEEDDEEDARRGAHMHIRGDHVELVVGGRLDVRSAADARTVLHSAVDDGVGDLVLDLSELDSWDATGLGVIMGAHRRAGRCGRRLVLRDVPPQMQRLLVATRLHRILAIEGGIGVETLPRV
jgi:anti-anti-sigma factor